MIARASQLFLPTLRDAPADADAINHKLLVRGGFVRQVTGGVWTFLPLGWRVHRKVEQIIREEMDAIGCQEMLMPVLTPLELWQQSGRDYIPELFRLKDRKGADYVLPLTHEETVTFHARELQSYRQLPQMLYHFSIKERDEPRPRAGLIRLREFIMKDAYSFDADEAGLQKSYAAQHGAYVRTFQRMGLEAVSVESDTGAMGGDLAHEFQVLTEVGEDTIVVCETCDYKANMEKARRKSPAAAPVAAPAAAPIATPGVTSIEALEASLKKPASAFLKTLLLRARNDVVAVVLPGDRVANEAKLRKLLDVSQITFAGDADFAKVGGVAGFVGPVGLKARLIIDTSVEARGYISGANRKDTHLENVVPGRDFPDTERADVHDVQASDLCPVDGGRLVLKRGVEVGNIFAFATYYSAKMGATFLAEDGTAKPFVGGSYGIGVGRCVQTIIETSHDDKGIIWPFAVAPYEVHVVGLPMNDETVRATADTLVATLEEKGVQVLFDDRDESAGVKFADADLIGIPFRVTVSKRSLKSESLELKARASTEAELIPKDVAADRIIEIVRRSREAAAR